ncbi:hypothetical protein MMC30_004021 [Trapelia coarctata]|nr:hypothetical protein [Trapelia coarctata]
MSSRLMTMKFMQRAAASTSLPTSTPTTPPSAKRQKLDSAPSTPSDLYAVQSALAAEEAKRLEALERRYGEAGETKWVLSVREAENGMNGAGLKVTGVGYVEVDNGEEGEEEPWRGAMVGRRSFGRFNRALEKKQNPQASSSSSDSGSNSDEDSAKNGEEDSDASDDASGTNGLIREEKRAAEQKEKTRLLDKRRKANKAKKAELLRLAEVRKSNEVKLNRLTSISGGGGGGTGSMANKECHNCGKKGHVKKDCPERASKRPRVSE